MNQTFQNSAQVLSMGIFFTLLIVGLSSSLPHDMLTGLQAHGVPHADAAKAANLPAISIVFAAFLGYNPIQHLVGGSVLGNPPVHQHQVLTGPSFFPHLISGSFTRACTTRSCSRSSRA